MLAFMIKSQRYRHFAPGRLDVSSSACLQGSHIVRVQIIRKRHVSESVDITLLNLNAVINKEMKHKINVLVLCAFLY